MLTHFLDLHLAEDEEHVSDIDDEDSENKPEIDENYLNSDGKIF